MKIKPRYQRNTLLPNVDETEQDKINRLRVLVAGVGGLGSAVITNLACIGVERIAIADNGTLTETDFNRQYIHKNGSIGTSKTLSAKGWIKGFNPEIEVLTFNDKITEENIYQLTKGFDIVVDCLDNWDNKFMLNKACVTNNVALIHLSVEENYGQVMFIQPHKSACLECFLKREAQPTELKKGIMAPIINIIGAIATNEVVNFATDKKKLLTNTILSYDISSNTLRKLSVMKNNTCKICAEEKE